jgi:lysophospholipase L1-like esterase
MDTSLQASQVSIPSQGYTPAGSAPGSGLNVVCLGDSITADVADVDLGSRTGWIDQLQSAYPGATFANDGVCGNTLEQMASRQSALAAPVAGDTNVMIVWGGTNDLFSQELSGQAPDAAPVVNALATVVGNAEAAGWDTYVVSTLPRWCTPQDVTDALNAGARTLVDAAHFVDLAPLFQNSNGTANTSLYYETNTTGQWTHPDQQGDNLISAAMSKVISSVAGVPGDATGAGSLASLSAAQGFGTVATGAAGAGSSFTWAPPSQSQMLAPGY